MCSKVVYLFPCPCWGVRRLRNTRKYIYEYKLRSLQENFMKLLRMMSSDSSSVEISRQKTVSRAVRLLHRLNSPGLFFLQELQKK